MSEMHDTLIATASQYVGVREATNNNDGADVEMFQKTVDSKSRGESWCMAFVQFCLNKVEGQFGIRTNIYSAELCRDVWDRSPQHMRSAVPAPGFLVIWQHGDTRTGHTGIVTSVESDELFSTIEGNTSDGSGVVANGDGVYTRQRSINPAGTMKVLGFLNPFVDHQ